MWFGLCDEPSRGRAADTSRRGRAGRPAPWRPDWTDDEHARAVAHRPGAHRRGRDLPVQPHRPAALDRRGRSAGPLRPPGARPAGGLQRLPGPRPARRRQRQPRALLRVGGLGRPDAAHEGHRSPRSHDRRGPGAEPPPAVQQQGAGREPHDRRSAPQRPRAGGRGRQRRGGRALRPRALPDRLADDLAGECPDPAGHRPAGPVPRALPVRLGDRRPQAPHHAARSPTSSRRRGGSTAAPWAWSLPRRPRSGPGSTSPSGRSSSTAPRARPCTGRAAASPGAPRRRPNGRSCTPRRPSWPTT